MSTCLRLIIATALLSSLIGDDAYAAWSAGRPAESLPHLYERAQSSDRWDAWLDLGLCAAAADRHGAATVWLLEAQRRAPARSEPRQALAALGTILPEGYVARLGGFAAPGAGIVALPLGILAGLLLGYAVLGRRGRATSLMLGAAALVIITPGSVAAWADGRHHWVGTASETQLLDSTGTPVRTMAEATVVECVPGDVWNGRIAVRLSDGTQGWLALADTHASP